MLPPGLAKGNAGGKSWSFTISTASVDRMGDTIAIDGWHLTAYRKNPVVLYGHDSSALPIGRGVAFVDGDRLKGTVRFAPNGAEVESQVANGFLSATSDGFMPLAWKFNETRKGGIDFLEQELLEFSVVPVPANSEATLDPGQLKGLAARERRRREVELITLRGMP
jgi:HK97 family phage prohead protease